MWVTVRHEQMSIVIGSALMFPGWTISNILKNTAAQLLTFKSSAHFIESGKDGPFGPTISFTSSYAHSLQAGGLLNAADLENMNLFHSAVFVVSLIIGGYFAARCVRAREFYPTALFGTVVFGLLANAFATGALGGVVGCYEGRGIWLIPFCTIVSGLVLMRDATRPRCAKGVI
jgi:hypothetical protein